MPCSVLPEDRSSVWLASVLKPRRDRTRTAPSIFKPGQICVVKESIFTPLCAALNGVPVPLETREGSSLTTRDGEVIPVSSGKERPCIIMDATSDLSSRRNPKKGYLICLMATFASSGGQYERLGKLLQRFVVPIKPNPQLPPDMDMDALKTEPAWCNPRQWAISFMIYTEQPMRPYTSRDGKSRRLSRAEYDRLAQHCFNQRALWERDTEENKYLKQEMYDELVDWKPDPRDAEQRSIYSFRSNASAFSVNSMKSFCTQRSRCGSISTLKTIFETTTPTYPSFTLDDFPPLPSKVCTVC
ncbi:hypothetical protein DFS33DRAFT_1484025 [Desarmillaria ectypa]|nr:hypothetical protein DFS33DRAFT_1484025 [Desarmillaria ectypa]